MSWERIRPLTIGVPRREHKIFVSELYDPSDDKQFYRPIGGGIEFGEYSTDALVREFQEELDIEVEVSDYLGTIENVFTFDDSPGHEVVLVYEIAVPDVLYDTPYLEGYDDGGVTYTAEWKPLSVFEQGNVPLYPTGVLTLLTEDTKHVIPPE